VGSAAVIETIAAAARDFAFPLVVDPVMISKHGLPLMADDAAEAMRSLLLPKAVLITPNLPEAARLTGQEVDSVESMQRAARRLVELGARAALVKGGHLEGSAIDVLFDGRSFHQFAGQRIATPHTHGTGCAYSAAITAELAGGASLPDAIARAKSFIAKAIASSPGIGHGHGPINHFAPVR
jgi:hydroxymethylpyrimidine/phosphomethylpyrimidine kinase